MTNEQAITELMAVVKVITQAVEEIHNYMTVIDKRITALEAKQDNVPIENTNRPTDNAKNELLARIVNNSSICRNCDIYRDAWNACFMASECLTNDYKFFKQRNDEEKE